MDLSIFEAYGLPGIGLAGMAFFTWRLWLALQECQKDRLADQRDATKMILDLSKENTIVAHETKDAVREATRAVQELTRLVERERNV